MSTRIKTIEQLEEYVGAGKGLWFLSVVDADFNGDMSRKDHARMLMDGVAPMKDRWEDVLSTLGEDDEGNLRCPNGDQLVALMKNIGW